MENKVPDLKYYTNQLSKEGSILFLTLINEAAMYGADCVKAVANVILNRAKITGKDTAYEVIATPTRFPGFKKATMGSIIKLPKNCDEAIKTAFNCTLALIEKKQIPDRTNGSTLYGLHDYTFKKFKPEPELVKKIGQLYFFRG